MSQTHSGIYCLVSLDGAPLSPVDLEVLRLGVSHGSDRVRASGFAGHMEEPPVLVPATSMLQTDDAVVLFAGYLDEEDDLRASLGLHAKVPTAAVAWAAVERFGPDAPRLLVGSWSLLRWEIAARELTLLGSEDCRDPLYYATDGKRLAIAPDQLMLCRLPWVGRTLDPEAFLLLSARYKVRRMLGDRVLWKGVRQVLPATREIFTAAGQRSVAAAQEPAVEPFSGSFEEAIERLTALGQRAMRQHFDRYGKVAFHLSGGLDSSLVTMLGALARPDAAEMFCVTSVAPPGSGLEDERAFSTAVADRLRVPYRLVYPAAEANIYRPDAALFAFHGVPIGNVRFYLNEALDSAAKDNGAAVALAGGNGELSLTATYESPSRVPLAKKAVRALRAWRAERREWSAWPADGFTARLAPAVLATVPTEWREQLKAAVFERGSQAAHEPAGIHPALAKSGRWGNESASGVRVLNFLRDRRLVRFAATLPMGFAEHGNETRAVARQMLKGHIPEEVRTRPRGMPFSPDYLLRLTTQAAGARKRIGLQKEAGVGRWIDLPWLDDALSRLPQSSGLTITEQFRVQQTALMAEFLLWNATEAS